MSVENTLNISTLSGDLLSNSDIISIAKNVAENTWSELVESERKEIEEEFDILNKKLESIEKIVELKDIIIASLNVRLDQTVNYLNSSLENLNIQSIYLFDILQDNISDINFATSESNDSFVTCKQSCRSLIIDLYYNNTSNTQSPFKNIKTLKHKSYLRNKFQTLPSTRMNTASLPSNRKFKIPKIMASIDLRHVITKHTLRSNAPTPMAIEPALNAEDQQSQTQTVDELQRRVTELEKFIRDGQTQNLPMTPSSSQLSSTISRVQERNRQIDADNRDRQIRQESKRENERERPRLQEGPHSSRYDRGTFERNVSTTSPRPHTTNTYLNSQQSLCEIRISGLPRAISTDQILQALRNDRRNDIRHPLTYISHYTSIYQFVDTKTLILKTTTESARTMTNRGTAMMGSDHFRCSKIMKLQQCTSCLRYCHTKKDCILTLDVGTARNFTRRRTAKKEMSHKLVRTVWTRA